MADKEALELVRSYYAIPENQRRRLFELAVKKQERFRTLFTKGQISVTDYDDLEQQRIEIHKLNAMVALAEAVTCRRRVLLGYFGEPLEQDCGNCDVCLDPPETFDATTEAQKVLSCVYRVGQRFGARYVIDVLRGADTERIRSLGHDRLSTYGIGADLGDAEWASILRQLSQKSVVL